MNLSKLSTMGYHVLLRKKIPLRVAYFCTFRCNLKCKYCSLWKTETEEMTKIQSKTMIREFADAGTSFFMFTGGEPLLRKDIGELIDFSRDRGLITGLVTNGILLKKNLKEIKNLSYLVVSLDGSREINDKIRGRGSFDKAVDGIKNAKEVGLHITINSVLANHNIKNDYYGIRELIQISDDLECELNFSVLYKDRFNKYLNGKIKLDEYSLKKALDFIKEQKREHKIVLSESCIDYFKGEKKFKCYAGKFFCDVLPDGTVVPCIFENGVSGLKYGFSKAFEMLPKKKECSCTNTCYAELNSTLSLDFKSVINTVKKYGKYIR